MANDPWAAEKKALRETGAKPFSYAVSFALLQRDPGLTEAVRAVEPRIVELAVKKAPTPDFRLKAIAALVTLKTDDLATKLATCLTDANSEVVAAAAKAMGAPVRSSEAVTKLLAKMPASPNWQREYNAARALAYFDDPRVVPALIAALTHPQGAVGREALNSLGELGALQALEPFIETLTKSTNAQKVTAAARGLSKLSAPKAKAALSDKKLYARALKLARDRSDGRFGTGALGYFKVPTVIDDLIALTQSEDGEVQEAARRALVEQEAQGAIAEVATHALKGDDVGYKGSAIVLLMQDLGSRVAKPDVKAIAALAKVLDAAPESALREIHQQTDQFRYRPGRFEPEQAKRFAAWGEALVSKLKKNKSAVLALLKPD